MFKFGCLVVVAVLCLAGLAQPARAGVVNVANGKGSWQSTRCQRPIQPGFVGMDAETAAPTMNRATGSFNAFVQKTQEYMNCLASEAKADADASNSIIMTALDHQMQDAQAEVNQTRAQLFNNRK